MRTLQVLIAVLQLLERIPPEAFDPKYAPPTAAAVLCGKEDLVNGLPPELLVLCFQGALRTFDQPGDRSLLSPIHLKHVCKRWGALVWYAPALWTNIFITVGDHHQLGYWKDVLLLHLERSKSMTLSLRVAVEGPLADRVVWDMLEPISKRIHRAGIEAVDPHWIGQKAVTAVLSMANLTILEGSSLPRLHNGPYRIFRALRRCILREVTDITFSIGWPNLQELEIISNRTFKHRLAALTSYLRPLNQLQSLKPVSGGPTQWTSPLEWDRVEHHPLTALVLPRLQNIVLHHFTDASVHHILSVLDAPNLQFMEIKGLSDGWSNAGRSWAIGPPLHQLRSLTLIGGWHEPQILLHGLASRSSLIHELWLHLSGLDTAELQKAFVSGVESMILPNLRVLRYKGLPNVSLSVIYPSGRVVAKCNSA